KKVHWLANQLKKMHADIVGFQEIFHIAALKEILQASGIYDQASVSMGERNGEGPAVGLVSRFPILDHDTIPEFPEGAQLEIDDVAVPVSGFSRPVLKARLRLRDDLDVIVFVVHLKSKRPKMRDDVDPHDPRERAKGHTRSLMIRAAETTALRHLLLDTLEGTDLPVIIMGDLNDDGQAVTSKILGGSEPWRNLPLKDKRRLWDVHLYNVKDIQARQSYRDVYYTHLHNGHYDSLDHILVSQEFVRQNPNRLGYVEYVKVFNDHLIDETLSDDRPPKWESDHGQVTATIQLEKGIPGVW
ncbi:MAG: endonuclease/exonuclease/phosphatase family protein, partial [Anaerolineae bacterium]|nr:endonuclease/exonuclease/phosphatase family protein [Anaerolineae bacterium]